MAKNTQKNTNKIVEIASSETLVKLGRKMVTFEELKLDIENLLKSEPVRLWVSENVRKKTGMFKRLREGLQITVKEMSNRTLERRMSAVVSAETSKLISKVKKMKNKGQSTLGISKEIGASESTVRGWLKAKKKPATKTKKTGNTGRTEAVTIEQYKIKCEAQAKQIAKLEKELEAERAKSAKLQKLVEKA